MISSYNVRFAKYDDKKKIMSFIGNFWDKQHILSKDETFFDYQYRNNDYLQFVIALDTNNIIVGVLGFLQYNSTKSEQDIALALWKVIPNLSDPLLGIKLVEYLKDNIKHRSILCAGITKKTIGVYKFMGFQTGKLLHFAAFNIKHKNFSISIPPMIKKKFVYKSTWNFKKIESIDLSLNKLSKLTNYKDRIPYKSENYILKRYKNHPYFSYTFHEVYENSFYLGLIVSREIHYLNSKALRIIDVLAEDINISKIINEFAVILNNSNHEYEYVDIYASSLDINLLTKGNYEMISDNQKIIVPDRFSPFEKKNVDIYFCITTNKQTFLFKGDSDQDNPRIKKEM